MQEISDIRIAYYSLTLWILSPVELEIDETFKVIAPMSGDKPITEGYMAISEKINKKIVELRDNPDNKLTWDEIGSVFNMPGGTAFRRYKRTKDKVKLELARQANKDKKSINFYIKAG